MSSEQQVPDEPISPQLSTPDKTQKVKALESKKAALETKKAELEKKIADKEAEIQAVKASLKNPDYQATLHAHIELLHKYNDIKDIAQGLMGLIAENRGVRVREVYEEMGIGEKD